MFYHVTDEIYAGDEQSIDRYGPSAVVSISTKKELKIEKSTQTTCFDKDVKNTGTQVYVANGVLAALPVSTKKRPGNYEVGEKSTQTTGLFPLKESMTAGIQVDLANGVEAVLPVSTNKRPGNCEVGERSTQTTGTQVGGVCGAVGLGRIEPQAPEPSRTVTLTCQEKWTNVTQWGVDRSRNTLSFCIVCASAVG